MTAIDASTQADPRRERTRSETARARTLAFAYLALSAIVFGFFALGTEGTAEFRLTSPGDRFHNTVPDLNFDAGAVAYVVAVLLAILGGAQLSRASVGFEGAIVGAVGFLFVVAFLGWAAAGDSFSLVGMLQATFVRAVPLALGAFTGIMCERAGVVNIAIEGMLLSGAFVSALVGSVSNALVGVGAAVLTGGLLALVLAVLCIRYRADQIIVGVVINIFALGLTSFLTARILTEHPEYNNAGVFGPIEIPLLHDIPLVGPVLFEQTVFVYAAVLLAFALAYLLYRTRWGLRVRAIGEHPLAADTVGVEVYRMQYVNVVLGGMIAGLGGAYFIYGSTGRFDENMTNGRGFIALAAMIFGRWHPIGALSAALLFGFADALQQKLGILSTGIPSEFLLMAPFLVTIIVVAGFAGKTKAPAAEGTAYVMER